MNERFSHDEPLESLLDRLPEGPERERIVARLRGEGRGEEIDAIVRMDASLRRLFPIASAPTSAPTDLGARDDAAESPAWARRRGLLAWAGAAAAAAVLLAFAALPSRDRNREPFFRPTPLVALYRETVRQGFEPYYECRDEGRFARVFADRQGARLRLAEMPEGARMLGLSYPGGFTRDTTAMLCEVDGKPVMVFVDRREADAPELAEEDGAALRVFRSELPGLVVYEVTPLDAPYAAPSLRIAAEAENPE